MGLLPEREKLGVVTKSWPVIFFRFIHSAIIRLVHRVHNKQSRVGAINPRVQYLVLGRVCADCGGGDDVVASGNLCGL